VVSACLEDYGTWTCRLFSVKLKAGATQGAIYFCASKMGGSYGVRYPSTRLAIEKRNVEPMYLSAPSLVNRLRATLGDEKLMDCSLFSYGVAQRTALRSDLMETKVR